ncbi:hypothetical protein [Succinispira mobilis]|uniref:hypothetical protein n=1 Tax=Succinispira mobilis TaxID=78120 RepID=UPI0003689AF2|nr:hypothetical protein [Succinispira mobilis]
MKLVVTHYDKMHIRELFPQQEQQHLSARPFPHTLLTTVGLYDFAGQKYYLEQEGLYRFYSLDPETLDVKHSFQQIVYQEDTRALVSGLLNCIYDQNISVIQSTRVEYLLNISGKLADTTGFDLINFYMDELKIPCRQLPIYSVTGKVVIHRLLEIWDELSQEWFMVDPVYGLELKNVTYQDFATRNFDKILQPENFEHLAYVQRSVPEHLQLWMHNFQFNPVTYKYFMSNENLVYLTYERPRDSFVVDEQQAERLQAAGIDKIRNEDIIVKPLATIMQRLYYQEQIYSWNNGIKHTKAWFAEK